MSEKQARRLYAEAQQFSKKLSDEGWSRAHHLEISETAGAADLFAGDQLDRPLVVGLFGGTGVGKSSLLNRLAGSDIARTGVVRPTSMEITAYLHCDKQITSLPEGFPSDRFAEVRHSNPRFADVMWVDMPDFDSEETQNRDQVTGWLPHIDLLLYVVTPERYKDEEGWRLLIKNGYRHAWLFVMNQWDKGENIQFDDFKQLLAGAGFESPHLFCTVCADKPAADPQDDFDKLADFVARLAQRNIVSQLEKRGWLQRLAVANERLQARLEVLQGAEKDRALTHSFDHHWAEFRTSARVNLDLPFRQFSEQFSGQKTAALGAALKTLVGPGKNAEPVRIDHQVASSVAMKTDVTALWDDWSATRLQDAFSQFELAQAEHGVPVSRLKTLRSEIEADTAIIVKSQLQSALDKAITNPGSPVQRKAIAVLERLQWLLPLAAVLWVGYRIVSGFVAGAADSAAYVGMDFFVNGLLLVGVSWCFPWLIMKLLKPTIAKSVYVGLGDGLDTGLQHGATKYRERLQEVSLERNRLLADGNELRSAISAVCEQSLLLDQSSLEGMVLPVSTPK